MVLILPLTCIIKSSDVTLQQASNTMSVIMTDNIIDFGKKKADSESEKQFLALLSDDIDKGNIKEIPSSVFDRADAIKYQALLAKKRNDIIEM